MTAPDTTGDDDWSPCRPADPQAAGARRVAAGDVLVAVQASRAAGAPYAQGDAVTFAREPRPGREFRGRSPDRGDHGGAVRLVAQQKRDVLAEQPVRLLHDDVERIVLRSGARYQRRHAAQRPLLLHQLPQLRPRLGIRDRGRHELGEVLEARLGLGRERDILRRGDHHAPRPPLDGDWDADGVANAGLPDRRCDDAGGVLVAVHACRSPGPQHARGHAVALERKARPDRDARVASPLRDADDRAIRVVAAQMRGGHAEHLTDLPHHRGEDLVRRRLASDQRGHAPQRSLLVGEHTQLVATRLEHALRLA
jgi:hypothetical protein